MPTSYWRELVPGVLTIVGVVIAQRAVRHVLDVSDRHAWRYVFGFGFILAGALVIWRREVPVGIQGRPPSHISRGWTAIVLGALVVALGVVMLVGE